MLPALRQQVEGGGDALVKRVMLERFATFPQPQRSEQEWEFWWRDYVEALADQPAEAIRAGMRQWIKTDTTGFLPKPGQLLALVKAAAEPHWRAVSRATRLAKAEPRRELSPDDLEARKAMAANVRQLFQPKETKEASHEL